MVHVLYIYRKGQLGLLEEDILYDVLQQNEKETLGAT